MKIRYHVSQVLCLSTIFLLFWANSNAFAAGKDDFPNRPITFIAGWPGGGGGDQEIRGFALYLKKNLPVSTIIENIPGAATKIAVTKAWKAKPDGYTLVYITPPQQILNEYMAKTEYKTSEFVPVFSIIKRSFAMTVNSETFKSIDDFVKTARTRTVSIGLSSFGSAAHMEALAAVKVWGITVNWVPYETGSDAVTQVAGKHIDAAFTAAATAIPLMRSGKIHALLKFSNTPVDGFENVPSPKDLGYKIPIVNGLGGIVAPPKTPAGVVKVLEDACAKTVKDPELLAWAAKAKYEVVPLRSEEFRKELQEQYKVVEDNIESIKASMVKK